MSQSHPPTVRLPNVTPPKMAHPGPIVRAGQVHTKTPTATNRDKYENKPMPPTPETSPSPGEKPLTAKKNRPYIRPATPLIVSDPMNSNIKNRAVTDPVVPKPLFTNKPTTINQIRKKYSQTGGKSKAKKDEDIVDRPTSPALVVSQKASQILGVLPTKDNDREVGPTSAPPTMSTPDLFRTSAESTGVRDASPSRQVQSTPVLTRRYLQENHMPTSVSTRTSKESKETACASSINRNHLQPNEVMVIGNASLNPSRLGTFGRTGDVGYVGQNEMHRVLSFTGVIEGPDPPRRMEDQVETNSNHENVNSLRPQYSEEILHPMVYSPNSYAGIWENDPNVVSKKTLAKARGLAITLRKGHTLPPFSPYHRRRDLPTPAEADQHSFSQTSGDVPIVLQKYPGESSHGLGYTHSLRSQNSWAPSGNGNSFPQTSAPLSAAETTPRFTAHTRNNSVPPPPMSYPGFQPSGPLPPGLAQMELNLHHHIGNCFGSLMRLTTDNTDRTIDKMVRRAEESQEIMDKSLKVLRSEIKDLKKDVNGMREELANVSQADDQMQESIGSLGRKFNRLDQRMGEIGTCFKRAAVEASESEREEPSTHSQGNGSPRRRSRSTHASASSRQHYRPTHASGATSGSASTQHSVVSNNGRRSTNTSSRAAFRRSDERSGRTEVFDPIASTDGPAPDIRDHPAYRGVVEAAGSKSPVFQTPDYGEIWYQQAYGQRP